MVPNLLPPWATIAYPKLVSLWNGGDSCDVTIICIDGSIKAPSNLLGAVSQKLHEILEFSTDKVLQFKNVKINTWKDLLNMLYSGKSSINSHDDDKMLNLYSILLFAYYLGMDCVLKLFKHLAFLDNENLYSELWGFSCPEFGMDIQIEYSHIENGNATSYQTTFSTNDLSGLERYLQKPDQVLSKEHLIQIIKRNKLKIIKDQCLICGDKCIAEMVKCVHCNEVVPRTQGSIHMSDRHPLIPSSTWPFTCTVDTTDAISPLIGEVSLKIKANEVNEIPIDNDVIWYKCLLCESYHLNLEGFMHHFLSHGLFPCICNCCSGVFSAEEFLIEHVRFCSLPVVCSVILKHKKVDPKELPLSKHLTQVAANTDMEKELHNAHKDKSISSDYSLISVKKETIETKCIKCEDSCTSESVQCLYCYKVVPIDSSHMEKEHNGSLQAKLWVITCDVNDDLRDAMVLRKSLSDRKSDFECMLCHYIEKDKENLVAHLNNTHGVFAAFCCKFCTGGFSTAMARNGHQHLCGGGDCIQCKECNLKLTSYDQLQHHIKKEHIIKVTVIKEEENYTDSSKSTEKIASFGSSDEHESDDGGAFEEDVRPFTRQRGTPRSLRREMFALCFTKPDTKKSPQSAEYRKSKGRPRKLKNESNSHSKDVDLMELNEKEAEKLESAGGDGTSRRKRGRPPKYRSVEVIDDETLDENYVPPKVELRKSKRISPIKKVQKNVSDNSDTEDSKLLLLESLYNYSGPQKSVCFACKNDKCTAESVKCAYCYKVVQRDGSHMQDGHPFTPKGSLWAYTCRFNSKSAVNPHDWVVSSKVALESSETQHKCLKCSEVAKTYANKESVLKHMKIKHNITPFFCSVCEMGFSDRKKRKDHQHFCFGGKPLRCEKCNVDIGNAKVLQDHMRLRHGNKSQDVLNITEDCSDNSSDSIGGGNEDTEQISDNDVYDHLESSKKKKNDSKLETGGEKNKLYVEIVKDIENYEKMNEEEEMDPNVAEIINSNFAGVVTVEESEPFGELIQGVFDDVLQQDVISPEQRYLCLTCNKECHAAKVKCVYCYKIVDNDISHMDKKHPFTPRSSLWVFNCRFLSKSEKVGLKEWRVSAKEPIMKNVNESKVATGQVQYRCLKCKKYVFPTLEALKKHCSFKHGHSVLTCKICETGFSRMRYLRDHQHFCGGGKPLSCTFCERPIGGYKALEDHMHAVHMKAKKTPLLGEVSASEGEDDEEETAPANAPKSQSLKQKWKIRERNFRKKVSMRSGNSTLLSPNRLSNLERDGERSPYCTNCSSSECSVEKVKCLSCFKVVNNDPGHMDTMHPCAPKGNPWLYSCRFLLKTALAQKDWMVSRKEVGQNKNEDGNESSIFLHRCIKCNATFTTRKNLLKHMEYQHKTVPLLCVVCESGFINRKYLRTHEHYCSGGKVFKCPICNKEIGSAKDMRDHLTRSHNMPVEGVKRKPAQEGLTSVAKKPRLSFSKGSHLFDERHDEKNNENNQKINETLQMDSDNTSHIVLNYFVVVATNRNVPHLKMCSTCGEGCKANIVRCDYCGEIITSVKRSNHLKEAHPYTPGTSLWPVSCKFVKYQTSNPYILAKPTGEKSGSNGKEIIVNDPLYISTYKCEICDDTVSSSAKIEKHLLSEHSLKVTFCKQCGCGLKKGVAMEHVHFCTGGEFLKCTECDKIIGGASHAVSHRARIHPINRKPKQKYNYKPSKPKTKGLKRSTVALATVGRYGYNILSAECNCGGDICNKDLVKCGLCGEIVPKDDIHMKLKHPYTPSPTWIVYCRYSIAQCSKHTRDIVGRRVPSASEEEVLSSPLIPCSLPFIYQCFVCNVVYDNHETLREHVKSYHVEAGRRLFSCKHCESLLANMSTDDFSNHVHLCGEGTLFSCEFCDEVCTSYKLLYNHVAGFHPMEKLAKQSELGIVKQENMEIPEGTEVLCSVCEYKTLNVSKMRLHVKDEHCFTTTRLNQVCKFCYRFFKTRSSRERHEQHEHLQGQRVLCDICGKDFEIPAQLKFHLYYFHKGGRDVVKRRKKIYAAKQQQTSVCHHCGNVYGSSIACKQHIKNIHERNELYKCKYCPKTFGNRGTHKLHEDRHVGNKTHRCPYCIFKGYTGYAVNKHVEKCHPGVDQPFAHGQKREESANVLNIIKQDDEISFQTLVDVAAGEKQSQPAKVYTSYIEKHFPQEETQKSDIYDVAHIIQQNDTHTLQQNDAGNDIGESKDNLSFQQAVGNSSFQEIVNVNEGHDQSVEAQNLVAVMVDENVVAEGCYTFISY